MMLMRREEGLLAGAKKHDESALQTPATYAKPFSAKLA